MNFSSSTFAEIWGGKIHFWFLFRTLSPASEVHVHFPLEQVEGERVGSRGNFPWSPLIGGKEGGDEPDQ